MRCNSTSHVNIAHVDDYSLFTSFSCKSPAVRSQRIENRRACLDASYPGTGNRSLCLNASGYEFFDVYHPTTTVLNLIAGLVQKAIQGFA